MDESEMEYVGFWKRVIAMLIDSIWLVILLVLISLVIFGTVDPELSVTAFVVQYLIPAAITVVFWVRFAGTPGKMAVSARIVDAQTGEPLPPGRAVLRYIAYYISAIPLLAGFIWIAFDRRKQGWHDKIANSVVVRAKRLEGG